MFRCSNGIKCYNCGSLLSSDSACEDPFESGSVVSSECTGSCTKMKADRDGSQCKWAYFKNRIEMEGSTDG